MATVSALQAVTKDVQSLSVSIFTRLIFHDDIETARPGPLDPYPIRYPEPYKWDAHVFGFYVTYEQLAEWACDAYPKLEERVPHIQDQARVALDVLRWKLKMTDPYWLLNFQLADVTAEVKDECPEMEEEVGEQFLVLCLVNYMDQRPLVFQVETLAEMLEQEPRWWTASFVI